MDALSSHPVLRHPEVAVVYRYLPHYRVAFYEKVRGLLAERGVDFRLIVGRPDAASSLRGDAASLPWAEVVPSVYLSLADREVCWQPALRRVWGANLVIVEQASKLLLNYALLGGRLLGGPRVAFWGHGSNIQPHRASGLGETLKRAASRRVDWWFAYNERSVDVVAGLGYPRSRITCVRNAVDTGALRAEREQLTPARLGRLRARYGVSSTTVGVFCGALYEDKRLPFLVASCDRVRRSLPDFELVVIGGGPERQGLERAAATRPWLHVLGPLFGAELADALALGRVLLIPGLVGLPILDGFAMELPLVATAVPFHSHEIAYLRDGENGVMVEDWLDPAAYARAVVALLTDEARLTRLRAGCRAAAATYTVETMAQRFADGVSAALRRP